MNLSPKATLALDDILTEFWRKYPEFPSEHLSNDQLITEALIFVLHRLMFTHMGVKGAMINGINQAIRENLTTSKSDDTLTE